MQRPLDSSVHDERAMVSQLRSEPSLVLQPRPKARPRKALTVVSGKGGAAAGSHAGALLSRPESRSKQKRKQLDSDDDSGFATTPPAKETCIAQSRPRRDACKRAMRNELPYNQLTAFKKGVRDAEVTGKKKTKDKAPPYFRNSPDDFCWFSDAEDEQICPDRPLRLATGKHEAGSHPHRPRLCAPMDISAPVQQHQTKNYAISVQYKDALDDVRVFPVQRTAESVESESDNESEADLAGALVLGRLQETRCAVEDVRMEEEIAHLSGPPNRGRIDNTAHVTDGVHSEIIAAQFSDAPHEGQQPQLPSDKLAARRIVYDFCNSDSNEDPVIEPHSLNHQTMSLGQILQAIRAKGELVAREKEKNVVLQNKVNKLKDAALAESSDQPLIGSTSSAPMLIDDGHDGDDESDDDEDDSVARKRLLTLKRQQRPRNSPETVLAGVDLSTECLRRMHLNEANN